MNENRNLAMAVVFSVLILLGFQLYNEWRYTDDDNPQPSQTVEQAEPATDAQVPTATTPSSTAQAPDGTVAGVRDAVLKGRDAMLAESPRILVRAPRLEGSLALRGGRLDDLTMIDYRETLEADSKRIVLLSPSGAKDAYFADFGWVGNGLKMPDSNTLWAANRKTLTPETPVTLSWDNGQGLTFQRTMAIDENYMFTVTQTVKNNGSSAVTLFPYGLVSRHGSPQVTGFYILHEGLLGVFDETLLEVDYDELQEDNLIQKTSTGGWLGITDKYWLTALIPNQKEAQTTRFTYRNDNGLEKYQTDFLGQPVGIAPGASVTEESHLFAGAKEVNQLDGYEASLSIKRFDLAIDFGWFYFLTKPIFYTMIYINDYVGNYGIAILLLTVLIKVLFFPLANKSYTAMSKMRKLQPEMVKLRDRFGDDKVRLNQEMMSLYKREKANPASGCLPMIVQIPVFFALYKVLFVTIEMRHAPFFGWIHDLSAPDPTVVWNLFGLIPWDPSAYLPAAVLIGVWPLVMGVTMFLQQRLNPQPTDPLQAKIFLFLPIMFTFLLAQFPAGLVIYWAWNNLLSIIQQKLIMIKMGVK
ncbi:MAG: membrane protein insertase YidC [Rhodospirillaceae bacterium]|jgi:YidC/Oxa1 family membrane protein insertase|nr:membrane protein insertase YidC [Rhodospirillaceae bacterium]MBT5013579.1 membrane protein insertase YidC [Rhodospirillaceae bacterium]MBT5308899.1 membrane protein insertase YidC [Rhodospirillaceae bacterium]MBT6407761.1 membrane protein insertase YidC [Rhodospirillaceae bacterium]MBT7355449.1 membrane protein insertase YidC [Rhodospirillaceae bacterium]